MRHRQRPFALAACACLLTAATLQAQAPRRDHDITLDDYFTQADLFSAVISPDGAHVAYTEGRWQQATDDRKADLWVVNTKTSAARKLTFDRAGDRAPQWSADSRSIYFLGNRKREGEKRPPHDGKAQVWRVPVAGGEPLAVTRVEGGVEAFALDDRGGKLCYLTSADRVGGEFKALRERFKQLEYGHGVEKASQVWVLDLKTWRTEKVYDPNRTIREMALSPDGKKLAMITAPDDKVVSFEGKSRVDVLDLGTARMQTVPEKVYRSDTPTPWAWLETLAWDPDSERVAFNAIFDGYPAQIIVATVKGDLRAQRLDLPAGIHVRGYGSPLHWSAAQGLCYLGEEKARVRLCAARRVNDRSPEHVTLTPGDVVVEGFSVGRSGKDFALVLAGPTHFADVFLLQEKGAPRRLTKVNPQAERWKLPQLSVFTWKAPDGTAVEGILELPPGYKKGQRLPLVVEIHGGPTTAAHYKLQYWIYGRTLLPAKGYALLTPNYRGSTGYGDRFTTDLLGRENDLDVKDILAGVDALVEAGIADPERLGVTGWSNGGYLTNCIISTTTRFKAAVSGAGIVDAVMEWGSNDEPAYTMVFKKGLPWSAAERYHRASPTYNLHKVRTPTLIHVGANDERCPPGHSRTLYRALKEYVKVPTELLVYPGEGHGLMKYRSRQAKLEWDLAWFERYLKAGPKSAAPATR